MTKNFEVQESPPAWTQEAYRPPRSHSKSLLFREVGSLCENFFSQSEHVSSQIQCQKFFPFTGGGGGRVPLWKFFPQSEHVSSQIWCQKFFPLLGGGGVPLRKIFFPVWTCIKPKLVSKIFPFTGVGGPSAKFFFLVWTCIKPNLVSKIFPFTGGVPRVPPLDLRPGTPPDLRLGCPSGPETRYPPPTTVQGWIGYPSPPQKVNRQTFPSINITFPRTTYAGGKNKV